MSMWCGLKGAGGGLQQAEWEQHPAQEGEERAGSAAESSHGREGRRGERAGEDEDWLQRHRARTQAEICKYTKVSAQVQNLLNHGTAGNNQILHLQDACEKKNAVLIPRRLTPPVPPILIAPNST